MSKYPVYIPSKDRSDVCYTAECFIRDKVDFRLVVEPSQKDAYVNKFGSDIVLVLPDDGMRLLGSRLWIREHSVSNGFDRHWQFDDNIRSFMRFHRGQRIECNANIGTSVIEEFTDRYTNIGVSGFNYTMFVTRETQRPIVINCHVYSASLINNRMEYKWRLFYNDDTDLCLQVVTNNLCTVLFNTFTVQKIKTMVVKGGNTDDLYQKDGRLTMARTLEKMWPEYVTTKWRFGRPQHVVRNSWKDFKTPLKRRTDIDWDAIEKKTWDIKLKQKKPIKSKTLQRFYDGEA